jgi:hypothetical protein
MSHKTHKFRIVRRHSVYESLNQENIFRKPKPEDLMERMSRDHLDLLQNIEFMLAVGYKQGDRIDDRTVAAALEAAMHGRQSADPNVQALLGRLDEARAVQSAVDDPTWRDALQVVLESVHRHSDLRPRQTDYLDFIKNYVG